MLETNQEKLKAILKQCEMIFVGEDGDECTITEVALIAVVTIDDLKAGFVIGMRVGERVAAVLPDDVVQKLIDNNAHRIKKIKSVHAKIKGGNLELSAKFDVSDEEDDALLVARKYVRESEVVKLLPGVEMKVNKVCGLFDHVKIGDAEVSIICAENDNGKVALIGPDGLVESAFGERGVEVVDVESVYVGCEELMINLVITAKG